MRNLNLHTTESEVRALTGKLFRTEPMRFALSQHPFLADLMHRFHAKPRVTFEVSNAAVERGNFTSWYSALALREYENAAVNDVYYLHEIAHIATMPYDAGLSFAAWVEKMLTNEMEASVISEAYIYVLCPELRPLSFKGEIWVDRYSKTHFVDAYRELLALRTQAQHNPNANDSQETRIAHYLDENREWAHIWRPRYQEIEAHMKAFNAPGDRVRTGRDHLRWIEEHIASSGQPYPFAAEVEAFAAYCARDKSYYLDDLKVKKAQ